MYEETYHYNQVAYDVGENKEKVYFILSGEFKVN